MNYRAAIIGLAVLAACSAAGAAALLEAGNTPPSLAGPGRVETFPDQPSVEVEFAISDLETAAENLIVTASFFSWEGSGSNPRLLRPEGVLLGGSGHIRTIQFVPEPDEHGFMSVILTVEDEHGGTASHSVQFSIKDFSSYLGAGSQGGVLVDVDGDGWLDVLNHASWRRNVDGTSTILMSGTSMANSDAGAFAVADMTSNNRPDFATVGTRPGQQPAMRLFTHGTRSTGPAYSPMQDLVGPGFAGRGALNWGDYDLDGDMDLFAFGITNRNFAPGHMVWRNDGGITMSEVESNLPEMAASFAAWNDYNLDGAPDFFLAGTTNRGIQSRISKLMVNDGEGWFTPQPVNIAGMGTGVLLSGDMDNDGRPDIFFGGSEPGPQGATNLVAIFKNMEDGTFEPIAYFESLLVEGAVLFDLNNDGLLDLMYFGEPIQSFRRRLKVYINAGVQGFQDISPDPLRSNQHLPYPLAIGDFDRDGRVDVVSTGGTIFRNNASRTNTPPGAPAELKAEVQGNEVLLSWDAATDENQSGGLTYNLRVGTQPGGTDIMSPLADVETGRRFIVSPGNAYQALRRKLRLLEPGTYYWSVQAVDHAYAGGAFAPEAAFDITADIFTIDAFRIEGGSGLLTLQMDSAGVVAVERSENLRDWDLDQIIELPAGSSVIEFPLNDNGAGDKPRFFRLRRDAAE